MAQTLILGTQLSDASIGTPCIICSHNEDTRHNIEALELVLLANVN